MSCDWNIWCVDCSSEQSFNDANHQKELMIEICQNAEHIANIHPLIQLGSVELHTRYGFIDTAWFVTHRGHKIVPKNEYGHVEGECNKPVLCGECKTRHRCSRDGGHDGDCKK